MLSYSNYKFTQIMNQTNWHKGEIVHVPRKSSEISSGMKSYEHFIGSRYVCIREEDGDQAGILLKVLGKITSDGIMLKGGEPFCKDDKEEAFSSDIYYSYRFPSEVELKEVLHMIRHDQCLIDKLEEASMHIIPILPSGCEIQQEVSYYRKSCNTTMSLQGSSLPGLMMVKSITG